MQTIVNDLDLKLVSRHEELCLELERGSDGQILCPICGAQFEAKGSRRKYCRPACSDEATRRYLQRRDAERWIRDPDQENHRLCLHYAKDAIATGNHKSARRAMYHLKASGGMREPTGCHGCGSPISVVGTIQQHHVDYSQPFSTIPLCARCHAKVHRGEHHWID